MSPQIWTGLEEQGRSAGEATAPAKSEAGCVLPDLPLDELLGVIRSGLNRPPVNVTEQTREVLSAWCDEIEVRAQDYVELERQDAHVAAMEALADLADSQR